MQSKINLAAKILQFLQNTLNYRLMRLGNCTMNFIISHSNVVFVSIVQLLWTKNLKLKHCNDATTDGTTHGQKKSKWKCLM